MYTALEFQTHLIYLLDLVARPLWWFSLNLFKHKV